MGRLLSPDAQTCVQQRPLLEAMAVSLLRCARRAAHDVQAVRQGPGIALSSGLCAAGSVEDCLLPKPTLKALHRAPFSAHSAARGAQL